MFSLRLDEWEDHIRTAVQPEPGEFATSNFGNSDYKSQDADWKKHNWTVDLVRDFAHRGLQVIVKLANIELTPQNPKYEGGSWHVEGQLVRSKALPIMISSLPDRTNISVQRLSTIMTMKTLPTVIFPSANRVQPKT